MNHLKTFFFLLICIALLSGCNNENTTSKVKKSEAIENEKNNKTDDDYNMKKNFNFTIDEFVSAYNEVDSSFENKKINFDEIGDYKLSDKAKGQIYKKELLKEFYDSDSTFILDALFDLDKNFYRLNIFTTGSGNISSEQGMRNTLAVLHILGIDFKHLNDFLYNDEEALNIIDGDYSVQLTKIPSMSLILNIEPK
ncbi:hypothetical protein [Bacillus pumilus]|uniref:hypothetical protein n=1 Tax=Bacillus pumilus TaxID=1408 RepID=UPI00081FD4D7|nr:hypothetical protein [Bacillus pumilus]AOC55452.1 hypothetical protein BEN31_00970 [Bacillus pumilus]MBR0587150.1 hypothetical protein [Bacillus pumilus DW2J2]MBR0619076.1 hypothetical protein [Bacillus pumilus]MBR0624895.1 hypothetical protein [Bacillus pumilus]MCY7724691.1 hypothetical protein [Bacillus pumilus]